MISQATIAVAALAVTAAPSRGQSTQPATGPAADALTVREWVVFVASPTAPLANAGEAFKSTLPKFAANRRAATADAKDAAAAPQPVGVIRVFGAAQRNVDVRLEKKAGTFNATWPKPKGRANGVMWDAYDVTAGPQKLEALPEGHWLAPLRGGGGGGSSGGDPLWVTKADRSERFMLYDVELPYALPLRVERGDDATSIRPASTGGKPLRDVAFYRGAPGGGGWVGATVAELPSAGPTTRGASTPPSTGPTTQAAAPTAAPTTALAAVRLQPLPGPAAADAMAAWRQQMTAAGFPPADQDAVVAILARHGADAARLTAVYRLPEAELDQLLPLEVTPAPARVVRFGLVIARGIDPAAADEIDALVAQLGDPSWAKREAASKALAQLGQAARQKIEQAAKSSDVEVAWRAEQLLAAAKR